LINQNAADIIRKNLTVRPVALTDYYLESNNGLVKRMLYTLSFVGLFILLMAVVNFVNMSISSSSKRMKEIGMRKVMGGLKKHIVIQFLVESVAIVFLAGLLALAFYTVSKPVFGQIVGKELPDLADFPLYYLPLITGLITLIGGLAGIYPALVLSSLNSIDSLKGKMKTVKEKVVLRKSLVGFQFCIAAVVMVAAFVVSQQVAHFFSRSLGYNKDFIVSSQVPRDWSVSGFRKMQTVRNEFAAMPEVRDVTLSYEIPNGMNGGQPAVYRQGTDSTGAVAMESMLTDEHYLDTYQIPLRAGRFFRNIESDTTQVVINEKAVTALGWKTPEEAVGQQIKLSGNGIVLTIQGVTRDFHFHTMQRAIPPIIMLNVRLIPTYRFLSFKLKPGNIGRSIEAIQKKWAALLPGSSFEYRFMDDALRKVYASELQIKKAASTATVLALVIVLLGVLGLLSLSVQKRTKEIGIRKVLGASLSSIISLFLKEFLPVLLVGGLVAIPISLYFMKGWLNNYAYRIELSALPFLMTLFLLVLVTSLLITLKVVRASAENPVKNLRTE
jgi:putative ABC transport system permease protein